MERKPEPVFYEEDDDIVAMVNDLSDENLDVTAFSQTDIFVSDFTVDNIFSKTHICDGTLTDGVV